MHIICGLGNPGEEYEHTRHNAGFDSVDALAEELRVNYWKNECGALTAKTTYKGEDLLLVDEIEMVRRFVEQQQLRILRQNLCEKRALQFAAGERKNRLLAFVLHAGQG